MPILPGGDVLPSFLSVEHTHSMWSGHNFTNTHMRVGEVQEIIYPTDKRSLSKRNTEYNVLVQQRSNKTGNSKLYQNVALMNTFGGIADQVSYTLRAAKKNDISKAGLGKGSKVLLMCVNGETNSAFIIGGIHDQGESVNKNVEDLGHHFYANFNGVSAFVDKDGQFVLTYNGKTDASGKTDVDDGVRGTAMSFLKDGSWNVATTDPNDTSKHQQFMFLDHGDHATTHQAHKEWLVQVVEGPAKIKSRDGLKVGNATDHMLLGESFRKAQSQLNSTLKELLTQAATQLSGAVSTAPGAPLPQVNAAGALLLAAAQAIDAFEQTGKAANSFLSRNNQSD